MHIRISSILALLIALSGMVSAQSFVALDWAHPETVYNGDIPIQTHIPGFAGARHQYPDLLPYYVERIDLGRDYAAYDYEVRVEYPEFQEITGKAARAIKKGRYTLPALPEPETHIAVSAKNGVLVVSFVPLVFRDGKYQRLRSFKLTLEKKPLPALSRTRAADNGGRYKDNSVLATGKWVKIRLTDTGVHQITHNELSRMGFSNPAKVRLYGYGGLILPEDVRKTKIDDLQELPLWREADRVLFYANGTIRWELVGSKFVHSQNYYSSHAYYFLTQGEDEPMTFPQQNSLVKADRDVTTFADYALYEKEAYSWREGGRKLYDDYDYRLGDTKSYPFELKGLTADSPVTLTVAFSAYSKDNATTTTVMVSNSLMEKQLTLGSLSISKIGTYDHGMDATGDYQWKDNVSDKFSVVLKHNRPNNTSGRLDYIRVNYQRELALYGDQTTFRSTTKGDAKYTVKAADANTRIWNVTNPADYKQIVGSLAGSQYEFIAPALEEYVAVNTKGTFPTVEVVGTVENQNLHALNAIDMVIIAPANAAFVTQAERLAEAHRERDGLSVQVVTAEQVYNEFSSGTPDGTAYRWLMKMLYDRARMPEEQPKYLLLFGDGAYDNRMLSQGWKNHSPKDFLLCHVSENSVSEVSSYVLDDYYGFLDDGEGLNPQKDVVDIGVGRFPVRTATQAKQLVDKTIDFMYNKHAAGWKNVVSILGDDGTKSESESSTGANVHMRQSEEIASIVESSAPEYQVKRIYWDAYKMEKTSVGNRYPEVTKEIVRSFNDGTLMLNYTGHGGPAALSHEYAFIPADIAKIKSSHPTLFVTAACEVAPFDAVETSLAELLLLHPTGGAIAAYSTTRTVYSSQNSTMNKAFTRFLFTKEANGRLMRLGDVVRLTKADMATNSASLNNLHFVFLGDPAMRLVYSDYQLVVDEFNGLPAADAASQIKAGGVVKVKGHVRDNAGQPMNEFAGLVYPTVLDTKEQITGYNNNGYASTPFVFERREKKLFSGGYTVENGRFEFEFPVPMDINYSNQAGLINFYALNTGNGGEGQGIYSNFLVGGTDENIAENDSLGPKIYLYLNTHDFAYGGKTNETPYLVAELEDEDGINTSGNGIGHDIVAMIDNSPARTYTLNSYYEPEMGSYRKGTVRYSLPELPEGKHRLFFRAWDVRNNSSSTILDFEVVKGYTPTVLDIECTSPVKDNAEFIIKHDRPESEVEVQISVCDLAGKLVWLKTETMTPLNNQISIGWDVVTNDGVRLSPGLYLFRASLSSGGDKQSTRAKKIVVLAQ